MITLNYLKLILHYNPSNGLFYWRVNKCNKIPTGSIAGGLDKDGYVRIHIDYRKYQAHRLAWFYMTGVNPAHEVDHENTIRNDNRWLNLREATDNENAHNSSIFKNNTSGFKGVDYRYNSNKFRARIMINRKRITLGEFNTPEEASAARTKAALELHGEFARVA